MGRREFWEARRVVVYVGYHDDNLSSGGVLCGVDGVYEDVVRVADFPVQLNRRPQNDAVRPGRVDVESSPGVAAGKTVDQRPLYGPVYSTPTLSHQHGQDTEIPELQAC